MTSLGDVVNPSAETIVSVPRLRHHRSSPVDQQRPQVGVTSLADPEQAVLIARAVVSQARHRDDPLSRWVTDIAKRRHPNVAAVALANKTARIAWAMLRNDTEYDAGLAVGRA